MNYSLTVILASTQLVFAGDVSAAGKYTPDSYAVTINSSKRPDRSMSAKQLDAKRWSLTVFGNNVTSGTRLSTYSMVRAAMFSQQKGFAYFKFQPTRKSVMCYNKLVMTSPAAPYVIGTISVSGEPKSGYLDAREFIAANAAALMQDAPKEEKRLVFADWSSRCSEKRG